MTFFAVLLVLTVGAAGQQEPSGRGRSTPPQPQQKQGVDYFIGAWTFTWTGRESPVTAGPRGGTTVFARQPGGAGFDIRTEGKVDDTDAAFRESGGVIWNDAEKSLAFRETLANGTELVGTGDWSSPLSIRYESEPARADGQTVRIRRTYAILSAHSFSVAEEISIDGGPFQRLGNGLYTKAATAP